MYKNLEDYINSIIEDVETAEADYESEYTSEIDALVDIFRGSEKW